jgi:hypothetical protein
VSNNENADRYDGTILTIGERRFALTPDEARRAAEALKRHNLTRIAEALERIEARMVPQVVYKTDVMLSPSEAEAVRAALARTGPEVSR